MKYSILLPERMGQIDLKRTIQYQNRWSMTNRKTVGELSQDLLKKQFDTRDPIELQREMQQEYLDNLVVCVEKNKNQFKGNFYVVVITKKEPLMPNVLRNYFFARTSCPTPDYDQTVYRYNASAQEVEYVWCIPDRETCFVFLENKGKVIFEETELLQTIIDFDNGLLYKLAKKFNNESDNSILIDT